METNIKVIIIVTLVFLVFVIFYFRDRDLNFGRQIETSIPPEKLWGYIEDAFYDSTQSPLWPNDLETIRSGGLKEGTTISVTYKGFGDNTYDYRISNYTKNSTFTYTAKEGHPFHGGGKVIMTKRDGITILDWNGQYTPSRFSLTKFYFKYFTNKFFNELEKNIARLEKLSS